MIVQKESVRQITARCAALEKTIIAGGPLFSADPGAFPQIHHFVLGEAEEAHGASRRRPAQWSTQGCLSG